MLSASDSSPVGGMGAKEGGEGEGDDVEGTGLLAETMRKVDRSFRARLVAGPSDDLGYQYFVEKVHLHNFCCYLSVECIATCSHSYLVSNVVDVLHKSGTD